MSRGGILPYPITVSKYLDAQNNRFVKIVTHCPNGRWTLHWDPFNTGVYEIGGNGPIGFDGTVIEGFGVSNGITITPYEANIYVTDTCSGISAVSGAGPTTPPPTGTGPPPDHGGGITPPPTKGPPPPPTGLDAFDPNKWIKWLGDTLTWAGNSITSWITTGLQDIGTIIWSALPPEIRGVFSQLNTWWTTFITDWNNFRTWITSIDTWLTKQWQGFINDLWKLLPPWLQTAIQDIQLVYNNVLPIMQQAGKDVQTLSAATALNLPLAITNLTTFVNDFEKFLKTLDPTQLQTVGFAILQVILQTFGVQFDLKLAAQDLQKGDTTRWMNWFSPIWNNAKQQLSPVIRKQMEKALSDAVAGIPTESVPFEIKNPDIYQEYANLWIRGIGTAIVHFIDNPVPSDLDAAKNQFYSLLRDMATIETNIWKYIVFLAFLNKDLAGFGLDLPERLERIFSFRAFNQQFIRALMYYTVRPKIQQLMQAQYSLTPFTKAELESQLRRGILDQPTFMAELALLGYNDVKVQAITQDVFKEPPESTLRELYSYNFITKDQLTAGLKATGIDTSWLTPITNLEVARATATPKNETVNLILQDYIETIDTKDETTVRLQARNLTMDQITEYLQAAKLKVPAFWRTKYHDGIITLDEYKNILSTFDFTGEQITAISSQADRVKPPKLKLLTQAEYVELFVMGKLTLAELSTKFSQLNINPTEIPLLLALAESKIPKPP